VIPVPLYHSSYPCKCDGKCDYSKANEDAGLPQYIDCEYYIKKDFEPMSKDEYLTHKYLNTKYCLKK
jgi:hypothetical protein